MTLPKACQDRADAVRDHADAHIPRNLYPTVIPTLVWRVIWDAPAAGEIPRPVLADGQDLADHRPDLADDIWHHVAGATILGRYCCGTPASHRDALQALAREILAAHNGAAV